MNEEKKKKSNKILIVFIIISILLILIVGVLFYLYNYKENNKKSVFIDSGSITMKYSNNSNIFFIKDIITMSDKEGIILDKKNTFYDFTIDVNLGNTKSSEYEILLKLDKELTNVNPENIKVYLEKQDSGTYLPIVEPVLLSDLKNKSKFVDDSDSYVLTTVKNEKNDSHNYRLRMWLAQNIVIESNNPRSCGIEINISGKTKSK